MPEDSSAPSTEGSAIELRLSFFPPGGGTTPSHEGTYSLPFTAQASTPASTLELVSIMLFVLGISAVFFLLFLRSQAIRSEKEKSVLHLLTHCTRDRQAALYIKLVSGKVHAEWELKRELEHMLSDLCLIILDYFQTLTGDKTISTAFRIAVQNKNTDELAYETFARQGLNPNRKDTSESIPANEGIPRFLREEKNSQGVLIYHDLPGAADVGAYKWTKNDGKYKDEITTMMVAPLNAWQGRTKQDMIGILFIGSRRRNVFDVRHVDSVALVADHVAATVANVVALADSFSRTTMSPSGGRYV